MDTSNVIYYVGNFEQPEMNAAGKRVLGNALIFEKIGYKVVMVGKSKETNYQCNPKNYNESIIFYSFPDLGLVKTTEYIYHLNNIISSEGNPVAVIRYGSPGLALFDKALINYCKKRKCPIIADVVDWLPSNGSNIIFNLVKSIDTYLEKAVYNKKSDGIITISSYLSDYYKSHGCQNVVVIPPIVNNYKKNTYQSDYGIVNIVYAGIPFRLKKKINSPKEVKDRLDLAIEGLMKIDNDIFSVSFNIYGITEKDYLTAYPEHNLLLKAGNNRVIFHGKQPMNIIQAAVNKADLTILLRNNNRATSAGFPTKVVESLSCGTPVITTDTSDLRNYIRNKENGFFVTIDDLPDLTLQLDEAITFYFDHKDFIKETCYNEQHFIPDKYTGLVKNFLSKVRGIE